MPDPTPKIRVAKLLDPKPEPAEEPAPKTGRQFPCLSCAARLDFDPTAKGLKCPYCGYEKKIEADADAEIVERDYLEYLSREEGKGKVIEGRSSEVRCGGCGANVLLEGAWHSLRGPPPLLDQASAVWEVGLMLRLSLTRHVRFAE